MSEVLYIQIYIYDPRKKQIMQAVMSLNKSSALQEWLTNMDIITAQVEGQNEEMKGEKGGSEKKGKREGSKLRGSKAHMQNVLPMTEMFNLAHLMGFIFDLEFDILITSCLNKTGTDQFQDCYKNWSITQD